VQDRPSDPERGPGDFLDDLPLLAVGEVAQAVGLAEFQ
jgi:hypothetical protein